MSYPGYSSIFKLNFIANFRFTPALTKLNWPFVGEFLKLLTCFSATSMANAASMGVVHVRLFSAVSLCLPASQQTKNKSIPQE